MTGAFAAWDVAGPLAVLREAGGVLVHCRVLGADDAAMAAAAPEAEAAGSGAADLRQRCVWQPFQLV